MPQPLNRLDSLNHWLQYIYGLHPAGMELGLERIRQVAQHLSLERPAAKVITVAGTNGKGSCIATMQGVLLEQGARVGGYTSPHIEHFSERITINGEAAGDGALCSAFAAVEAARADCDVRLTFFEFTTLAALLLFQQQELEVALLEVGMGGRLDAVNLIAADVCVITAIDLDHQKWLGDSLAVIGREKAGILRPGVPVVLGSADMPQTVFDEAERLGCPVYQLEREYSVVVHGDLWDWRGAAVYEGLHRGNLLPENQGAAIQALLLAGISLDELGLRRSLAGQSLAGRFEGRRAKKGGKEGANEGLRVILDVAHNPAACHLLAGRLGGLKKVGGAADSKSGRCSIGIVGVLAVAADKDIEGMFKALMPVLDVCYVAEFDGHRAMAAVEAENRCRKVLAGSEAEQAKQQAKQRAKQRAKQIEQKERLQIRQGGSVMEAYRAALSEAGPGGCIVVTGSFMTVAAVRPLTVNEH